MGAAKVGTDPVSGFLGAEEAVRLNDSPLAMDPLGFDRVEPGALDVQGARHEAHPLPALLDLSVVRADPGPHPFTRLPAGAVPHQQPDAQARLLRPGAAPTQQRLA